MPLSRAEKAPRFAPQTLDPGPRQRESRRRVLWGLDPPGAGMTFSWRALWCIARTVSSGSPSPQRGEARRGAVALAVGHGCAAYASVSPLQPVLRHCVGAARFALPPAGGRPGANLWHQEHQGGCSFAEIASRNRHLAAAVFPIEFPQAMRGYKKKCSACGTRQKMPRHLDASVIPLGRHGEDIRHVQPDSGRGPGL